MRHEFNEDHPPTEESYLQFDWAAVGGDEPVETAQLNEHETERLLLALGFILDFIAPKTLDGSHTIRFVGKRALVALWCLDPGRLGNASLRSLARALGCSAPNLSPLAAEFSRRTGIANRLQIAHNSKIHASNT